nr:MAG: NEDD4 family-interacting protein [Sesarmops intermedium nimavirus]
MAASDQGEDSTTTTTTAGSMEDTLPDTPPPPGRPLSPPSFPDFPPPATRRSSGSQRRTTQGPPQRYVTRLVAWRTPCQLLQSLDSGAGSAAIGGLDPETAEIELGTDFIFFITFAAAFVLNIVGYCLVLYCYSHIVAGNTGAQAGFGFSMAMWAAITTRIILSYYPNTLFFDFLLFFIMTLCMLICMHAILCYIYVKRMWHQVSHNTRHRLFHI